MQSATLSLPAALLPAVSSPPAVRARSATIARRLDSGERLDCRIGRLHPAADPWARLEFAIFLLEQSPKGRRARTAEDVETYAQVAGTA